MMTSESSTVSEGFQVSEMDEIAIISYKQGKFEEAVKHFSKLILDSGGKKDVEWYIKRCDCYQHLYKDDEAMNDANMVIELSPESYKGYLLLGTLHQVQGRYDEALFCYFDCLETICKSGLSSTNVMNNCLDCIIQTARFIATLSSNIRKKDIQTQLFMLGNGLRREVQYTLAIKALRVALIFCEYQKDVANNENMRMKVLFALAQCLQENGKFEEAIDNFQSSLGIALKIGDVSFETKAYISLSSLCSDQYRHAEAASYYIKLLAVGEDVLLALGDDKEKFREHWPVDMETNILLNLCIAFKTLRLYDEALIYAERYANLVRVNISDPTSKENDTAPIISGKSNNLSGLLQSKFILGDLHELRGDLDQALLFYEECTMLTKAINEQSIGIEDSCLLDSASALSCKGNVLMKKKNYESALHCFLKQSQIAKVTKIPELLLESALSRGDALISVGRFDEARDAYNYALKLCQKTIEDIESECMCMWKVASVFSAERRHTTAAYYCEQAVALANKCPKRSVQMKLKFELALYYQHSSSPKELQKAFRILYGLISFQEEHIFSHRLNGGKYFHEEENMLQKCYIAIQVVLHKLGELDICASFGEACRRRPFVCCSDFDVPKIPDMRSFLDSKIIEDAAEEIVPVKLSEKSDDVQLKLDLMDHQWFLPKDLMNNALILTFDLCDEGILSQILQPGMGVSYSYLSSEHNPDPFSIRLRVERLVLVLCEKHTILHKESPKDKFSALEEFYTFLIRPLENLLQNLSTYQHIVIVSGKDLKKVPFASLRNPDTGHCLSKRFNLTMSPCTYLVKSKVKEIFPSSQKNPDNELIIKSLESSGLSLSISQLVTKTATQTSIFTSPRYKIPFRQKSEEKTCCVIGCPELPPVIKYGDVVWKPKANPAALLECKKVAKYLNTSSHLGREATKICLAEKLESATIVHVMTIGDLERGVIALTPDPFPMYSNGNTIDEESYLFTKYDFESLSLKNLQLLVLNSGSNSDLSLPPGKNGFSMENDVRQLPELFLAAGAASVVCQLWKVPGKISEFFFSHFYLSLQFGNLVSKALDDAKTTVSKKYSDHKYWAGFMLLGVDSYIDLSKIRQSQLHSSLNLAEGNTFYSEPTLDKLPDTEKNMENLQRRISQLSYKIIKSLEMGTDEDDYFKIVTALIDLLEEAMDRLTADSNTNRPVIVLSENVESCKEAVMLLSDLDFDFQDANMPRHTSGSVSENNMTKTVVFPHWNKYEMLLPTHQALTGLHDICSNVALRCITKLLPLSQDILCALIDLLAITRHTPNVLLRIHDDCIQCLWKNRFVRGYLCEIGFSQVHELVVFFKTSRNRTLLVASLQLFASVCLHRDQSVIEELNIGTLGKSPSAPSQSTVRKIGAVNHAVLPGNEVILLSSWMQQSPEQEEKTRMKYLANQLINAKSSYKTALERVKWWYNSLQIPQAQIKLLETESLPEKNSKQVMQEKYQKSVKILKSADSLPLNNTMTKVVEKRERARSILQKRCSDAMSRFRNNVLSIYERYSAADA